MRGKYVNRNALSSEMQPASELDDIVNSPKYEALLWLNCSTVLALQ